MPTLKRALAERNAQLDKLNDDLLEMMGQRDLYTDKGIARLAEIRGKLRELLGE